MEGVDIKTQIDALLGEGCSIMQSNFYGKPKPSSEIVVDAAVLQLPTPKPHGVEKTFAWCAGSPIEALYLSKTTALAAEITGELGSPTRLCVEPLGKIKMAIA